MKLPSWLSGPSKVSCKSSGLQEMLRIDCVRYDRNLRMVRLEYTEMNFTRRFLAPWTQNTVDRVWLMDASTTLADGKVITVKLCLRTSFEEAVTLAFMKISKEASAHRMQKLTAQAMTG